MLNQSAKLFSIRKFRPAPRIWDLHHSSAIQFLWSQNEGTTKNVISYSADSNSGHCSGITVKPHCLRPLSTCWGLLPALQQWLLMAVSTAQWHRAPCCVWGFVAPLFRWQHGAGHCLPSVHGWLPPHPSLSCLLACSRMEEGRMGRVVSFACFVAAENPVRNAAW